MQDTLLRVLVVALGLLTYPRDDPAVEEWDEITTVGIQKHEDRLLRGGKKLDHEPVSEDMTYTDNRGPWDGIPKEQNQPDEHVTKKDQMSVTKQVSEGDDKLEEGGRIIENTALKTSQINHEQKGNLQLDMSTQEEDIQTDGSFRDPSRPQGQQEKPEENETFSSEEKEPPLSHRHTKTSDNETSEGAIADWESGYFWYIWNMFSIISMIRFLRKYLGRNCQMKQEETRAFPVTCTAAEVQLPDSDTLLRFHSKYIKVSSHNKWREEEFLEGFANALLEAMRTICAKNGSMVIGDFEMMDVCDIIVPFSPPDQYSFQCLLLNNQASDSQLDMPVCGQIKLVENKKIPNGCHCQSSDSDDMVCLLHCESERVKMKMTDVNGLLCMKNSPFLSKSQVTRWFQSTIKQAWALISHKYEFELNIRYIDAPGALVVRFRSGKKISFSFSPVVKFNTDAHFFITSCSPNNLDSFWTLSLTNYQDRFFEHFSKHLPENSCHSQTLDIVHFLHRQQTTLSGSSALKDFHFKTALMHLLLTKAPSQWKPNHVACRLRDVLAFLERSLKKKLLQHVLIGNPLTQKVIELPAEFTQTPTVNLFHPLVVHNCIYRNAVMHFQDMLRNAHMLIHDYVDKCTDCSI